MKTLWIAEDDADLRFVYAESLQKAARLVFFEDVAALAAARAAGDLPSAAIIDLNLADGSMLDVFAAGLGGRVVGDVPFMVVSSLEDEEALRACFRHGARDYLIKPFRKRELLVKVGRLLEAATAVASKPCEIDHASLTVRRAGAVTAPLTAKELRIITLLLEADELTVPRDEILSKVWAGRELSRNTLNVHMMNLRSKLRPVGVDVEFRAPGAFQLTVS